MKIIKYSIISLALLIVITQFVSAFAITTFYWDPDKPLIIKPGESADVYFQMQNMVGSQDKTVKAEIASGSEIAKITDPSDTYLVPAGRKDINVNVRVSIPETDPIGKKYKIGLDVKELLDTKGGMVEFSTSLGSSIPVYVGSVESPAENVAVQTAKPSPMPYYLAGGLALLIAAACLVFYLRRRNRLRKRNK